VRMSWRTRGVLILVAVVAGLLGWACLARRLAPVGNTALTHFDAIIVLGYPADGDGNPTPLELAQVTEAVKEYERGAAAHLIFTGGAVANQFVEAEVMARTAEAQGIPETAVVLEPRARNTMENACYAVRMMKARGWGSAEVVSSAWHLQRAGLMFSRMPIAWRMHAAPALEPESGLAVDAAGVMETLKTVRYLVWTRPMERCEM
ncbi:MAG: YdcF family protein, partial [Terracidiphilus sp.]